MKLHTDPDNLENLSILIAARLTNQDVEIVEVKTGDSVVPYLSRSNLPTLEIEDGKFLFSSNTAAKYLYLKAGKIADEDAENNVLDWEQTELRSSVLTYLRGSAGSEKKTHQITNKLSSLLQELDKKLSKSKYLLGDHMSISDVCVFSTVLPILTLNNEENLTHLKRWYSDIKANPSVQDVVKKVHKVKGSEILQSSNKIKMSTDNSLADHSNAATVGSTDEILAEKLSQEEIDAALTAWKTKPKDFPIPRKRKHPVLPEENSRNILITSSLPYVNNVPHLGNIIGCVLSGDVYSRFCRLRNYNILYVCGTDEYGTATETKAMEEGVTPKEICDKYSKLHAQIYKWFGIDFDYFGRTTTEQQTQIAQSIFWRLNEKGYILKDSVDQLYCAKCAKFLADRFVEGTCPLCDFIDARGDQCDGCGKLINAVELKNPKCKICKSSPAVRSSQHLFLDLPKLEPELKIYLDKVFETGTWTNNARVITSSWIRDGLKPRCISRDLKWGTPIPLEGYTDKVFYVWFDAPIGYISITANYTEEWQKWWKNPGKVELYNFLGKDNVPFHSVIFPACLLGADDGYTVVSNMIATEYLNYEDTKFSKSRNTGIFGDQAETTAIASDVYRFYLLFVRPESQDTTFSWDDFLLKNNSELLNNLGNFINRALMFLYNNFGGVVQEIHETEEDLQFIAFVTRELKSYINNLESCRLRDGIRNILAISRLGNQYMQSNKPWVLTKGSPEEKKRAGSVVSLCSNVSCLLSVLLHPYMPSTSALIQQQLQAPMSVNVITSDFLAHLQPNHKIGQPSPLFQKIEAATINELKLRFAGKPQEKTVLKTNKGGDSNAESKKGDKHGSSGNVKIHLTNDISVPEGKGIIGNPAEVNRLSEAVASQGSKIRELKASRADKSLIDAEVAILLQLKSDLAQAQGQSTDKSVQGKKKDSKK